VTSSPSDGAGPDLPTCGALEHAKEIAKHESQLQQVLAKRGPSTQGFRTTADRDRATGTGAVVRKRPGKEPAGS
jgi:hypothetical protein